MIELVRLNVVFFDRDEVFRSFIFLSLLIILVLVVCGIVTGIILLIFHRSDKKAEREKQEHEMREREKNDNDRR